MNRSVLPLTTATFLLALSCATQAGSQGPERLTVLIRRFPCLRRSPRAGNGMAALRIQAAVVRLRFTARFGKRVVTRERCTGGLTLQQPPRKLRSCQIQVR